MEGFCEREEGKGQKDTSIGSFSHGSSISRYKWRGARRCRASSARWNEFVTPPLQYRFRLFRGMLVCAPPSISTRDILVFEGSTNAFSTTRTRRGKEKEEERERESERGLILYREGRVLEICFRRSCKEESSLPPRIPLIWMNTVSSFLAACLTAACRV